MMFQVNVWSTYNYHVWALTVLTTATELIIDMKGALVMLCLANPRLVTFTKSIPCHCEAFSHYCSRCVSHMILSPRPPPPRFSVCNIEKLGGPGDEAKLIPSEARSITRLK